jgi:dephospho-CoA kinase
MTPSGISQLSDTDRAESLIVYVDVSEEIRRERMSLRKDADDVNRRIAADAGDFKDFSDYDVKVDDPNFKEIPNILFTVLKKVEENI